MQEIKWSEDRIAAGGFGNMALYWMCEQAPTHTKRDEIQGKIFVIGGAYSASPTRGAGEYNGSGAEGDEKLIDFLAKEIKEKGDELDLLLSDCRKIKRISIENLEIVSKTHYVFQKTLVDAINKWRYQNGRTAKSRISFSSKYLHFHAPMAFFIYDSVVNKSLRDTKITWPKNLKIEHPKDYARHCLKCLAYASQESESWTPRSIDKKLYKYDVLD